MRKIPGALKKLKKYNTRGTSAENVKKYEKMLQFRAYLRKNPGAFFILRNSWIQIQKVQKFS